MLLLAAVVTGLSPFASSAAASEKEQAAVSYSRDIKPIFSNRCYACHGPDASHREADLRLDLRHAAIAAAIEVGDAEASQLIERVSSEDDELRMPPPASKKPPLTPREVDLLRRWINQGAKFDAHWAYVKPARPELSESADAGWAINAVDHFVAAKHRELSLSPAAEADRRTLIRRLSFDLTGLPPSPAEVDAFVADSSPLAYEELVDRLLASPHYGERLAMYWLDLVRYADTNGIHGDNHRDHALYRDYVIEAFNNNMPFDRFTLEQLAGDLLPNATVAQTIASGYNRLNMTTREGGSQAKEFMAKYAADRVRNASSVWLGTTLACCECHDHKFDPFTQEDFYSFAAFFADVQETAVGAQQSAQVPTEKQAAQLAALDADLAKLRKRLATATPELAKAQAKWEQSFRDDRVAERAWLTVSPRQATSAGKATLKIQDDQSVLAGGASPAKDTYTVTLETRLPRITGIRLEALADASLPGGGISRAGGNFVLTEIEVDAALGGEQANRVAIAETSAGFSQQGFPVAAAIDGKNDTGWAVSGHKENDKLQAVFQFAEPIAGKDGATITVRLRHDSKHTRHILGRFRLALTSADEPSLDEPHTLPAVTAEVIAIADEQRNKKQRASLAAYYRSIAPQLAPARDQAAQLVRRRAALTASFRPLLITTAGSPREMRVLPRGNWLDDSGKVVAPAVPAFLGKIEVEKDRADRLDLARWLIDRENPLVARVMVNRLWKLAFGRGLVASLDDYGTQGALPSHGELLDWLALEFIDSGWNVKQMLKLIVMSRTYRQSSQADARLLESDPANRWLARQGRYRIDAELVRDNALAVSGLLSRQLGGDSVKPYQPAGYWSHLNFPKRTWQAGQGEDLYRRGLYTYWCRTFLHPSLLAFDAPSREACTVERPRSNTPLQALVLLNDPSYVEAARALATRVVEDGATTPEERIESIYRRVLQRSPSQREKAVLIKLYEKHFDQFTADTAAAEKLLHVGASPAPSQSPAELAAWTSVARVLLNLHETITRY